MQTQG